jgi:hypothetical protein|uniref:hypothetical protein n=1 Tax=Polaromonas sp. 39-63-25 TaxID=1970420 RepID=UPI0025E1B951|nr:hypothetical protein [Polaromonas sp. 39-63-25]
MSNPMASAHKANPSMQVSLNEFLAVKKGLDKARHGSCNACAPSTQTEEYSTVTEVELRGLVFRLCPACANTLKLTL